MNNIKSQKLITLLHLFAATLLAPFFIMVAITGGLYVADIKPKVSKTDIIFKTPINLDNDSITLDQDIREILKNNNINVPFEYIKNRGDNITTRPTSRTHVQFNKTNNGWDATLNTPNFHYSMMELHKGHGPIFFKKYQIIAGIALFMIMMSGLIIGILAKAYRKKTIISTAIGSAIFIILAFLL